LLETPIKLLIPSLQQIDDHPKRRGKGGVREVAVPPVLSLKKELVKKDQGSKWSYLKTSRKASGGETLQQRRTKSSGRELK
jgi:hypothetical protein